MFAGKGPARFPDEPGAPGVEAGDPAVNIEIAFLSGRQGELTCSDRFFQEKFLKLCVSVFGHWIGALVESRKSRVKREGIRILGRETEEPSPPSGHEGAIRSGKSLCSL